MAGGEEAALRVGEHVELERAGAEPAHAGTWNVPSRVTFRALADHVSESSK